MLWSFCVESASKFCNNLRHAPLYELIIEFVNDSVYENESDVMFQSASTNMRNLRTAARKCRWKNSDSKRTNSDKVNACSIT